MNFRVGGWLLADGVLIAADQQHNLFDKLDGVSAKLMQSCRLVSFTTYITE